MKSTNANVVDWYATCPYCEWTVDESESGHTEGLNKKDSDIVKNPYFNVWRCPECKKLFRIDSWDT